MAAVCVPAARVSQACKAYTHRPRVPAPAQASQPCACSVSAAIAGGIESKAPGRWRRQGMMASGISIQGGRGGCRARGSAVDKEGASALAEESLSANWGPVGFKDALKFRTPSASEAARTAVSLVRHGTLCTISSEDGTPIGSHVHFVVEEDTGSPIIRIPPSSMEDTNLLKESHCSLYIHPSGDAADAIARVTLAGEAIHLGKGADDDVTELQENFASAAGQLPPSARSYDDLLHDEDDAFRFHVRKAYVRRLTDVATQTRSVEVVDGEAYASASCDPLAFVAGMLVKKWNEEHVEELVRFCNYLTGTTLDELEAVKLLWIDRLGMYIRYQKFNEHPRDVRMGFPQPVDTEKAVVSALTMLGQVTWEKERSM